MAKIIYPLLARSFKFLRGPVCYFSEKHYLAQINETDFGIVLTACPDDYRGVLAGRFRCVYYDADDAISDDQMLQNGQLIAFMPLRGLKTGIEYMFSRPTKLI